jgi:RNA polymerase sigma factor (sigma-70 family)
MSRSRAVATAALDDAALAAQCRAGDDDAWVELVRRYGRYVHGIAVNAFRLEGPAAEDVFQETMARVHESLGTLREGAALGAFIGTLARRLCVDHLRATRRLVLTGEDVEPPGTEEAMALLDEALSVRAALDGLAAPCREILERFFCRDESYAQIAAAMDLPMGTVASRISRCLDRLREAYVA